MGNRSSKTTSTAKTVGLTEQPPPRSTSGARAPKGKPPPPGPRKPPHLQAVDKLREKEEKNKILSQLKLGDNPDNPFDDDILGDKIATEPTKSDGKPTTKPPPGKARAPRLARRSARTLDTDAYAVALKM